MKRTLTTVLLLLTLMSCEKQGSDIFGKRESVVTATINGSKYEAQTIIEDNRSDPNRFGFASTDLRDTGIELDFPKYEVKTNGVYDLKNQPWNDLDDKITLFFNQPNKSGHYVFSANVTFTKVVVDEYYEGEFEFTDNYYPAEQVTVKDGKFKIYL